MKKIIIILLILITNVLYVNAETENSANISFGVISAVQQETAESARPGGGENPRISVKEKIKDYIIDKDKIKIRIRKGEKYVEKLNIKNIGEDKIKIQIDGSGSAIKLLEDTITNNFILETKKDITIYLTFNTKEYTEGVYTGIITVNGDEKIKLIPVSVEVVSEKTLLDVETTVINPLVRIGDDLISEIRLFKLQGSEKVDVKLEWGIKDLEGNKIITSFSVAALETQASFSKKLRILLDDNIKSGTYVFYVEARYEDAVAVASQFITIERHTRLFFITEYSVLIIVTLILLLIFIIIYLEYRIYHEHKKLHHIIKHKIIKRK